MAAKKKTTKKAPKNSKKPTKKTGNGAVKAAPKTPKLTAVPRQETTATRDPKKRAAITELLNTWNTQDHTVAAHADQVKSITTLRRPSGIMALDIDCGGGLPAGRLSMLSGPFGAGKTYLMTKYMAMHQRLYGNQSVLGIVQVEPYDYARALNCGLVISVPDNVINEWNEIRKLRGQPEFTDEEVSWYKRQIGEVVMMRGYTGDESLGVALDAVRSGLFGIVGIDSLSVMLPAADVDKDVGDQQKRASNATLITDFVKKYTPMMNALDEGNYTTVIAINQVRANNERAMAPANMQKYMKEWATTGAWAMRHLKAIDVQVWNGSKVHRTVNGVKQTVGKELKWMLDKGKDGTHEGKTGDVPFYFEEVYAAGVDDLGSVITEGIRRGVFQLEGHKVRIVHPTTSQTVDVATNATQLQKMMAADIEYEMHLRHLLLESANIRCLYQPLG